MSAKRATSRTTKASREAKAKDIIKPRAVSAARAEKSGARGVDGRAAGSAAAAPRRGATTARAPAAKPVAAKAVPAKAVPAKAVPAKAVPAKAVPGASAGAKRGARSAAKPAPAERPAPRARGAASLLKLVESPRKRATAAAPAAKASPPAKVTGRGKQPDFAARVRPDGAEGGSKLERATRGPGRPKGAGAAKADASLEAGRTTAPRGAGRAAKAEVAAPEVKKGRGARVVAAPAPEPTAGRRTAAAPVSKPGRSAAATPRLDKADKTARKGKSTKAARAAGSRDAAVRGERKSTAKTVDKTDLKAVESAEKKDKAEGRRGPRASSADAAKEAKDGRDRTLASGEAPGKAMGPTGSQPTAQSATPAASAHEVKTMSQTPTGDAPQPKSRGVLRIAAGQRRPKERLKEEAAQREAAVAAPKPPVLPVRPKTSVPGPKIEINPKHPGNRGVITVNDAAKKEKPMSVAQRNRAAAEAAFLRVAPQVAARDEHPAGAAVPPNPAANGAAHGNGSSNAAQVHKSQFEMRISERDSLTTALRLAETQAQALEAARELAERFQLPPDQSLLVKVIGLGEPGLTKLALEELLELDDRGRVRRTPDLREALDQLKTADRETTELKELLLEKIGDFGT